MKKLTPFKWFVLENFPFIEADFDALTEWQLFCKLGKEINKIINKTNTLGTKVEEISTFFDNLDVQEEINNKLNEMAESGQLTEIIAQYLNLAGVLAFNTINDLKNADNLINGSITMTFGKNTYNDGLGAFYKIRQLTSQDVIDNDNIVAVNFSDTLIAEKQQNSIINNLSNKIDIINSDSYIFVGDSYGASENNWVNVFCNAKGLELGSNAFNVSNGGAGFIGDSTTNTFLHNLQTRVPSNINKSKVKNIIVCGGWNDRGFATDIEDAIITFMNYCKQNYPNAKVYVGMISNYSKIDDQAGNIYWRDYLITNIIPQYKKSIKYGAIYLNNVDLILHDYSYFQNDYIHPNADGETALGLGILESFENGLCYINKNTNYLVINSTNYELSANINPNSVLSIESQIVNNLLYTTFNGSLNILNKTISNSELNLEIATYTDTQRLFRYVNVNSQLIVTFTIRTSDNILKQVIGRLQFNRSGKITLYAICPSDINNKSVSALIDFKSITPKYINLE